MKRIVTTCEIENSTIIEVRTVWTDEEANKLLSQGWVYLHGGIVHKDKLGYQAKNCYQLGKTEKG